MAHRIVFLLFGVLVFFTISNLAAQEVILTIQSPSSGGFVLERPIIEGTVSTDVSNLSIIVHPVETSDYWVQPEVTVRQNGEWICKIYIGRPGKIDVGKQFEIRAVANPERQLSEGQIFGEWPEAQWKSEVIQVIRK